MAQACRWGCSRRWRCWCRGWWPAARHEIRIRIPDPIINVAGLPLELHPAPALLVPRLVAGGAP